MVSSSVIFEYFCAECTDGKWIAEKRDDAEQVTNLYILFKETSMNPGTINQDMTTIIIHFLVVTYHLERHTYTLSPRPREPPSVYLPSQWKWRRLKIMEAGGSSVPLHVCLLFHTLAPFLNLPACSGFMPPRVPQPGENDDEVSSLKPRLLDSERLDFSVTLDSLDSQGQNDLFTAFVHEYAPLGCPGWVDGFFQLMGFWDALGCFCAKTSL